MTPMQFLAISQLLRLRKGPASTAAYAVWVDGIRQIDAAIQTGATPQSVNKTVRRIRLGYKLCQLATGKIV